MERLDELAEMLNRAKKILESEGKDLDKAIKELRMIRESIDDIKNELISYSKSQIFYYLAFLFTDGKTNLTIFKDEYKDDAKLILLYN